MFHLISKTRKNARTCTTLSNLSSSRHEHITILRINLDQFGAPLLVHWACRQVPSPSPLHRWFVEKRLRLFLLLWQPVECVWKGIYDGLPPRIAMLIGKIGTLMKIAGVYWYWTMMINIDYYMVEIGVPGTLWQPNSWKAHKSTAYDMDEPCTTCSSMWELSEMGPAVNLSSWPWQATASSMRQGIWQWLWARISPEWVFIFGRTALLNAFPWCWTWKYAFRLELLVLVRLASLAFDLMIRNIRSTCHNQS